MYLLAAMVFCFTSAGCVVFWGVGGIFYLGIREYPKTRIPKTRIPNKILEFLKLEFLKLEFLNLEFHSEF